MGLIKKCPCKPDAPTGNSKIEKCPQCRCESGMCGSYAKMIEEESANIEIEKIGTTLREPNVLMINAYLRNHGKETSKYKVRYALKEPNTGVVLFSGITQGLSLDSGSTEISNWTWNNIAPGEYLVEVDVGKENKSVPVYVGSFGANFPLTNTIYPLIILVMGLLLAYYVWKGMKNKKGGLTIVLLTVLLASVVLLINSPAISNTTSTGEQKYVNLCSLETQQDSEILYGDTFLLCDGQSARLPGLNVKLIGIGAHPKIETMEDGVNHTKVMVSDAVKINFRNYTLIKTFANGIILNIEDLRTDIMPSTNGEFSVKEFSPVRLHNTRISLMVYRDLDNKAHVAVVFGDAVDVKELKQGLEMHLSSAGKWVALSYLGEKKGMHTFRLYRGDQE
ncbi:MAG: hypothetical protein J7L23_03150 [Candidatus Diapherotrites archaeon]|nr:hypothetical protein [Candidatus Diapherotrites archaeon]